MGYQLNRRRAYRSGGGGGADVSTTSLWDAADLSGITMYSEVRGLAHRFRATYYNSSANPYDTFSTESGYDLFGGPLLEEAMTPHALWLTGGTNDLITCGSFNDARISRSTSTVQGSWSLNSNSARDYMGYADRRTAHNLFHRFRFTDVTELAASTKMGDTLDRVEVNPSYWDREDPPTTVSSIVPHVIAVDPAFRHWYLVQSRNETTAMYYDGVAYSAGSPDAISGAKSKKFSNLGFRILQVDTASGMFPGETGIGTILQSYSPPDSGSKHPKVLNFTANRDKWDPTFMALNGGSYSPSGFFANDYPICMQVSADGSRMAFLSITSTNGQQLSTRRMTEEFDIRSLSSALSARSMTDFQDAVMTRIGLSSGVIAWHWFKFSPGGDKLFLLSQQGILAKFHLTDSWDLATMELIDAVRLPATAGRKPWAYFYPYSNGIPTTNTYTSSSYMYGPVVAADIDPDGQTLLISVANRYRNQSSNTYSMSVPGGGYRLVQYRLMEPNAS